MECKKGYEIKVMKSAAGYYRGTETDEGEPNCRLSLYSDDMNSAVSSPLVRQYRCMENEFCNNGTGCFDDSTHIEF